MNKSNLKKFNLIKCTRLLWKCVKKNWTFGPCKLQDPSNQSEGMSFFQLFPNGEVSSLKFFIRR